VGNPKGERNKSELREGARQMPLESHSGGREGKKFRTHGSRSQNEGEKKTECLFEVDRKGAEEPV